MRIGLALLLILVAPPAGWSQVMSTGFARPLPTIGLPLPAIGLPLPPIGLPATVAVQPVFTYPDHRLDGFRGRHSARPPIAAPVFPYFVVPVFVLLPTGLSLVDSTSPDSVKTPGYSRSRSNRDSSAENGSQAASQGRLGFVVQPATAQVYVDGYYAGTAEDFARPGGELVLESGPHYVEINAPLFETQRFEVRVEPNRTITYRGALTPVASNSARPDTSDAPKTFYFIPGCYAGNISPEEAKLPASCDPKEAVTFTPGR